MVCQTRLVRYAEHTSLLNMRLVRCAHSFTIMLHLSQIICDIRHVHNVPTRVSGVLAAAGPATANAAASRASAAVGVSVAPVPASTAAAGATAAAEGAAPEGAAAEAAAAEAAAVGAPAAAEAAAASPANYVNVNTFPHQVSTSTYTSTP